MSFDISAERVRARVVRIVGRGKEVTNGQIPFTPRAKETLENADTEARRLGHQYIGTEHILLALSRDQAGVAARILRDIDVSPETIREKVARMVSGPSRRVRPDSGAGTQRRPGRDVQDERGQPDEIMPPAIDPGWLDGLPWLLAPLGAEIRAELGRAPDVGDLLLACACVPNTPAAQALAQIGIDVDQLWLLVERARAENQAATHALALGMLETAQAKEKAIEEGRFEDAARLRDQERQLQEQAREHHRERLTALVELRNRLGLSDPDAL